MSGGFSSGFSSGFQVGASPPPPPPPGTVAAAVVVGMSTNTYKTAAPTVWLYDPTTGNNVVSVNGTLTEFLNLSQFPGTFGFTHG